MSKSGQPALERLKEITNVVTGWKRKDEDGEPDTNPKEAKGGPSQGKFGGEGFTEAQVKMLENMFSSVTSAVEKSVKQSVKQELGSFKEDLVEMSKACADAIDEQNSALASIKSEVSDMKTKTSEEHLTKEINRIIGSAAVRGSSAPPPPSASAQIGQENLFCGPRKNLPSYDQRKKDIIYASDKLNMIFDGKIEPDKAMETVKQTIKDQGPIEAEISVAEVNHEGSNTRIVIKFEKTSTAKASQNRTAARNQWSPIDALTGRPKQTLTDDDLSEVKVTMYSPSWMKDYYDPLYEIKTMYTNQFSVDSSEVRVDKRRNLLLHGSDALAVLRFDGSVVLTPFLMKKNMSS